ncbi:MAG: sugar ABC transporter substrate-binding protein [bacterium]|nr:sugar ABC transporter substrate-binding protein [bacterium]
MRKLVALIFTLLLFISGCQNGKETATEIRFSTWGSRSEIATLQEVISSFEKENPDIKIKLVHIPDNYFQKLHLLIASDLAPDVMFVNDLNARIYIKAEKFEPLNSYIGSKKEQFYAKALDTLSFNGTIYAIPRDVSNMVIYYNADIFKKYNVPYPAQNWSLDSFLETAQLLTKDFDDDGKPEIFGFGFERNSIYWLPFLLSNGGGIISSDEKNIILGEKQSIEALQFYSDLRNKHHVAPKADEQSSLTTSQLFLQGKVAMHLCGRWCSQTYKNNADFNWDVANFPKSKMGSIVGLDASGWAISSSSKHKNEAWKFVEYVSSDKASKMFAQGGLIFPANTNTANSNVFRNPPPKNSEVFFETLNNSQTTPISTKYSEINDIINEAFEPIFEGQKNAQDVINNELLDKIGQKLN